MESNIFKIGNSLGVRIPKVYVGELELNKGDKVNMIKEENKLIITKTDDTSLKNLFEGYEEKGQDDEPDWGELEGDEYGR